VVAEQFTEHDWVISVISASLPECLSRTGVSTGARQSSDPGQATPPPHQASLVPSDAARRCNGRFRRRVRRSEPR
jgi:hypothetical protein